MFVGIFHELFLSQFRLHFPSVTGTDLCIAFRKCTWLSRASKSLESKNPCLSIKLTIASFWDLCILCSNLFYSIYLFWPGYWEEPLPQPDQFQVSEGRGPLPWPQQVWCLLPGRGLPKINQTKYQLQYLTFLVFLSRAATAGRNHLNK